MDPAKSMLPLKTTAPNKGQTLPHHLWLKSVLHDIHSIRTRTKALRRIAKRASMTPDATLDHLLHPGSPHNSLWLRVSNPITLKTITSPPIRHMGTLTLAPTSEGEEEDNPPPDLLSQISACFKAHRRVTRLLLKHARIQRRITFGKKLLQLFFTKPKFVLKYILRTGDAEENPQHLRSIGLLWL
jgi:hypothetical protein